jgi:hypothetical protein
MEGIDWRDQYSIISYTNPKTLRQISSLSNLGLNLREDAARKAHKKVYYENEGEDASSKRLGGAAAYQAFLLVG